MNIQWNFNMVKEYIEAGSGSGCKLLSKEYKNSKDKLQLKCKCGNIFEVTFGAFQYKNKTQCNECSHKNKHRIDLTNSIYGMLKVLGRDGNKKDGIYWVCKCECDNLVSFKTKELTRKNSPKRDCGCVENLRSNCRADGCNDKSYARGYCNKHYRQIMRWGMLRFDLENQQHGKSYHRVYRIYWHMKTRCCNLNNKDYKNYGERGIEICDEWLNDFMTFYEWAMNNGYSDELTIDRINNDGNYEPTNCRWATVKEQNKNKSNVHLIEHEGRIETLMEWSNITKINYDTMLDRYNKGYNPFISVNEQK